MINGNHYIIKENAFFNQAFCGDVNFSRIFLFDSSGFFSMILPSKITQALLERISTTDLSGFKKKFDTEYLLADSNTKVNFAYYRKIDLTTMLSWADDLTGFGSAKCSKKTKSEFTAVIPWSIFMGRKDQLRGIQSYLKGITLNRNATFKVIYINYDVRKDFINGKEIVNNFRLSRLKLNLK